MNMEKSIETTTTINFNLTNDERMIFRKAYCLLSEMLETIYANANDFEKTYIDFGSLRFFYSDIHEMAHTLDFISNNVKLKFNENNNETFDI